MHLEQVVSTSVKASERELDLLVVTPYRVSFSISSDKVSSTGATAVLDFLLLLLLSPNKFVQLSNSRAALRSAAAIPSSQAISGVL